MDTEKMLLEFTSKAGVPGINKAEDYAVQLLEPYGKVEVSPLGSVVCTVKEPKKGGKHVLLDAHIDEIGFYVTYIEDDGFLKIGQFGGTDPRLLAASPVIIHTKDGDLNGVIASIPPHLSTDEDKKPVPADKVYVDVGLSGEQAKEKIAIGDPITFNYPAGEMLNGNLFSKAMDDRAGCISLIKALEYLGDDYDCGLTVMFSNMEEIGGMGAQTTAYATDATNSIVVDVGFGISPGVEPHKARELTSGPIIGHSPILSNTMTQRLIQLAKQEDIPYTTEAMGGSTGTNADSVVTSRGGVATALLSIPLRYMHMPIETVNTKDVDNTGRLIAAWIKDLCKEEK